MLQTPPPLHPIIKTHVHRHHAPAPTCQSPSIGVQDPLKLGSTEPSLARFREAEVIHGRWAMLGVAGSLAVEVLGLGNWSDAPLWVRALNPKP